jgi:hypothetical protein
MHGNCVTLHCRAENTEEINKEGKKNEEMEKRKVTKEEGNSNNSKNFKILKYTLNIEISGCLNSVI